MINRNNKMAQLWLLLGTVGLAACGGGSSGRSVEVVPPVTAGNSFRVQLAEVKMQRLSNQEQVEIDVSAIGSAPLEYQR